MNWSNKSRNVMFLSSSITFLSCYHPVPSITATMEEMTERHTWAGQIMVSLDILCDLRGYFLCPVIIQFHPLPPQWRRCQKGTRGPVKLCLDILCVSIDLRVYLLCPVIIQFHSLPPQWRGYQKGTHEASSSIHYRHNGGDARKAHVGRSNNGKSV